MKTDTACVYNSTLKDFTERIYSLNYELQKKTVLKLEDKLLNFEREKGENVKKIKSLENELKAKEKVDINFFCS